MSKLILFVGTATLLAITCSEASAYDYNPRASAHAARTWRYDAQQLAPRVSERAAEDPYGPTVIASRPVPDTPLNRARFGEPLSRSGKMTAAIGD